MLQAGIDEVGMGALAGPMLVVGVVIESGVVPRVRDSKLVGEPERYLLGDEVRKHALFVVERKGTVEAMVEKGQRRTWEDCVTGCMVEMRKFNRDLVIQLDGGQLPRRVPPHVQPVEAVVNGDDNVYSIGAASLVAKSTRDRWMIELGKTFPKYGFEHHKGYGTDFHWDAIRKFGTIDGVHREKDVVRGASKTPAERVLKLLPAEALRMLEETVGIIDSGVDVGDWEKGFATRVLPVVKNGGALSEKQNWYVAEVLRKARKRMRIQKGAST